MSIAWGIWAFIAVFVLSQGWPFWPLLMITSALLIPYVWRIGGDPLVPLSALCGYIIMRFIMQSPPTPQMLLGGALWVSIGGFMAWRGYAWAGFAYLASGVVYPIFLTFGVSIKYLGIAPIAADLCAIAALWGISGGMPPPIVRSTLFDRVGIGVSACDLSKNTAQVNRKNMADKIAKPRPLN